jgi:hypothetical protein
LNTCKSKHKRRNATKAVIQVAVKIKGTLLIIINKSSLSPLSHQPKYQPGTKLAGQEASQASSSITICMHRGVKAPMKMR